MLKIKSKWEKIDIYGSKNESSKNESFRTNSK